jgi:hypothetical protein
LSCVCYPSPGDVKSSLSSYKSYREEHVGGRNVGKNQEQQREDKWLLVGCLGRRMIMVTNNSMTDEVVYSALPSSLPAESLQL